MQPHRFSTFPAYQLRKAYAYLNKVQRIFKELGINSDETDADFIALFNYCDRQLEKFKEKNDESNKSV